MHATNHMLTFACAMRGALIGKPGSFFLPSFLCVAIEFVCRTSGQACNGNEQLIIHGWARNEDRRSSTEWGLTIARTTRMIFLAKLSHTGLRIDIPRYYLKEWNTSSQCAVFSNPKQGSKRLLYQWVWQLAVRYECRHHSKCFAQCAMPCRGISILLNLDVYWDFLSFETFISDCLQTRVSLKTWKRTDNTPSKRSKLMMFARRYEVWGVCRTMHMIF